eukprot:m.355485 g.355485  ORF g.355485 m.355485 type:complete len:318 (+) comp17263_c0_seq1:127-1080(+)
MSIYRKIVWYMGGKSRFTTEGFQRAARHFTPGDLDANLAGQVAVVTGANSGLGYFCVVELAKRGAIIHMLCRNQERGVEAQQKAKQEAATEEIHLHIVDMADSKAVVDTCRSLAAKHDKINILINNAGCMVHKRTKTSLGFETNFAVNTLAPWISVKAMLPQLQKGNARIINVSSGGMLLEKLNVSDMQLDKMEPFDGQVAYSQQKRQQVVMSRYWASQGLQSYSMHPGWVDTPALKNAMPDFHESMKDKLRTVQEGADTVLWLAVCQNIPESYNGTFLEDRKPAKEHLPLAWTKSSQAEEQTFIEALEEMCTPCLE